MGETGRSVGQETLPAQHFRGTEWAQPPKVTAQRKKPCLSPWPGVSCKALCEEGGLSHASSVSTAFPPTTELQEVEEAQSGHEEIKSWP